MANPLSNKLISQGNQPAQLSGYELNKALDAAGNQLPAYDAGATDIGLLSTGYVQLGSNTANITVGGVASATPNTIYINATHIAVSLTDYANNAAALAGGLAVGEQYHTSGTVKVVI